jgi:hypothetical protein
VTDGSNGLSRGGRIIMANLASVDVGHGSACRTTTCAAWSLSESTVTSIEIDPQVYRSGLQL